METSSCIHRFLTIDARVPFLFILHIGCDCLGHIHYFDATLTDVKGEPVIKKKAVCMHEQDEGILWKHVEYRNGHNESRRARELILSSIATVVNCTLILCEYSLFFFTLVSLTNFDSFLLFILFVGRLPTIPFFSSST